ncbi:UNVERIFIED_CONTAM: hypothetical protein Sradi_2641400 [Sesamum radiatum]|uniref:Uncharacterized protein n=1 Tax=Sesamum radiatum TaxID=300843 RepID=A0AAW2S7B5_SESRA
MAEVLRLEGAQSIVERGGSITSSLTTFSSSPGEEAPSSSPPPHHPHPTNNGRPLPLAASSSSSRLKDRKIESLSSSKWPWRCPRHDDFLLKNELTHLKKP